MFTMTPKMKFTANPPEIIETAAKPKCFSSLIKPLRLSENGNILYIIVIQSQRTYLLREQMDYKSEILEHIDVGLPIF